MKKIMIALCGLTAASAFASDFNIGYINVDRVMAEATPAKTISSAIKAKYEPQQTKLTQLSQQLSGEESQLVAIQNKASSYEQLSKADKTKYNSLSEKFNKDKANFMQQYGSYQQQVNATEQYAIQAFLKQAYNDLKTLGSKNDLDAIYTSNQLIYAKAKYDMTDQFIKQIDQMDVSPIIKQIKDGPSAPTK
jgi:outer membrane protein